MLRIYHHDEFLARAVAPEIASITASMAEATAARNQRRRELRQKLTARASLAELLTQPTARQSKSPTAAKDNPPTYKGHLKLYAKTDK